MVAKLAAELLVEAVDAESKNLDLAGEDFGQFDGHVTSSRRGGQSGRGRVHGLPPGDLGIAAMHAMVAVAAGQRDA